MKRYKITSLLLILTILTCSVLFTACGHEHDFGKWKISREATCTAAGRESRSCDCGERDTREIAALGHNYTSKITKAATCTEKGVNTFTCENCDDTYTEEITFKEYTSTEIHDMYVHSVGEVITYDKSGSELALGSCFVYSADGKLITNYHVIENAYSIKVTFDSTSYNVDRILAYDKNIDLAVLKINASGLTAATVCTQDHAVGMTVYAFGNSKGLTSTFSNGMITYSNREIDGVKHVQHDAPISSGNSGGPLINVYGEVIGVNTWSVRDSQNLNFAVLMSEVDNLNFNNPMTVKDYYEKECDAVAKLRNHIIKNGELDDGEYFLSLGTSYSSDRTSTYYRYAVYELQTDTLNLAIMVNDEYLVILTLDNEISGIYDWFYFDSNDYEMCGVVNASSFVSSSKLSYTSNNVSSSSLRNIIRDFSTSLMHLLLLNIDSDLSSLGITVKDLGFTRY